MTFEVKFVPRHAIHLSRHDAEIEADVDEDGADRAAAVLGDDFLGRGQTGKGRILGRPGGRGGVRLAFGGQAEGQRLEVPAAAGALAEPGFERGGAEQAACDAGEDQREIGGAED